MSELTTKQKETIERMVECYKNIKVRCHIDLLNSKFYFISIEIGGITFPYIVPISRCKTEQSAKAKIAAIRAFIAVKEAEYPA